MPPRRSILRRRWSSRQASTSSGGRRASFERASAGSSGHAEAAVDAPAELRATSLFCEGFLVAHDTDDWHAAATLIDVGIDALVGVSEPPLILGMLHCLRGECDVFNGDPKSAVVRTQTGLEIASLYPGTWGRGFCLWNAAYARLAVGDEDAADRALHGGDRSGERRRLWHRGNGRMQRLG